MGFDVGGIKLTSPAGANLFVDKGAVPWMRVNPSGIVTRPQTPWMRGEIAGRGTPYSPGIDNPLMVTAYDQVGDCWNNGTGRFTCPVNGYYLMTAGNIAQVQAGYLYLRRNGATIHFTHWNQQSTWEYVNVSGIIKAAPGDYLSYHMGGTTPSTIGFYGDGGHNMYSIALLP